MLLLLLKLNEFKGFKPLKEFQFLKAGLLKEFELLLQKY
jgi:hypothetical protein